LFCIQENFACVHLHQSLEIALDDLNLKAKNEKSNQVNQNKQSILTPKCPRHHILVLTKILNLNIELNYLLSNCGTFFF